MKNIAVLTSGGDAPGMNACVRAVVRSAIACGSNVFGIKRGYAGLLEDDIFAMDSRSVSDIIHRGGTVLQSDRCLEFFEPENRKKAAEILRSHDAENLVVIGGDGSYAGALSLYSETGINVACIPGTIDNDLAYTEVTLGFDTAVNNVLWAINSLRDTMQSHNKVTIVEVMGRHAGDIALHAGVAGGAEFILVPERQYNVEEIANYVGKASVSGKKSILILLAEGAGKMEEVAARFEELTGLKPRMTRLGYIQRGGSPSHIDRILACRMGILAVKLLKEGKKCRALGVRNGVVSDLDLAQALSEKKIFDSELYDDASVLT